MHIVQSKILDKLTYAEELRYSQMRPERTESNLFAYHLKCLMKDGYIVKSEQNYTLSAKGKSYVDMISHQSLKVRHQPKIVTLLDLVNSSGETMLYRRKHQPYIGMLGYPSGKLHVDEKIESAAQRELKEKLHMEGVELEHRGIVYVRISDNGVFISQVLAHVFHGTTDEEISEKDVLRAERFWGKPSDFAENEYIPGFFEIKNLLSKGEFFFDELFFDLAD
jgi:ADP-ribose pyrophosphatase YjhB (NUDIX family)